MTISSDPASACSSSARQEKQASSYSVNPIWMAPSACGSQRAISNFLPALGPVTVTVWPRALVTVTVAPAAFLTVTTGPGVPSLSRGLAFQGVGGYGW